MISIRIIIGFILLISLFGNNTFMLTKDGPNAINTGTLSARATFECIGIELPFTGDENQNATCEIRFRKSGTAEWKKGLPLFTDYYTDRTGFRGSIVHLKPGTEYELHLLYKDPDGGSGEKRMKISTWSEYFPEGNTIQVKSRNSPLEVESGSAVAYKVYDGGINRAVIDANEASYCLNIENKKYIILRNLIFRESDEHAIRIVNSDHIIIEDCEIFEWRRPVTYCKNTPLKIKTSVVQAAAIQIESGEQIIIQHNYIHDPRGSACDWRTLHPMGPRGIYFRNQVRHSVFRYNRISGNPDHYYQDIITGGSQGPGSDVDIYGNEISHTWDDGIEIEGDNINIRVWNNVAHHVYKGVASDNNDHTYYGPVYIWRNIFTDQYMYPGSVSSSDAFKIGNEVGKGGIYLFNNTILGCAGHSRPNKGISNGPIFNLTAFNNIFDVAKVAYQDNVQAGSKLDHNGYSHARDADDFIIQNSWEKNGVFGLDFEYTNPGGWIFYIKTGNKAMDAGRIIDNFAEQFGGSAPDLGACEKGVWSIHVGPHADKLIPPTSE